MAATRNAGDDFYCDVAIPYPDRLEVAHQDERVLAFHHTRPFWRTHLVVVPVRHIASLTTVTAADEADVRAMLAVAKSWRVVSRPSTEKRAC